MRSCAARTRFFRLFNMQYGRYAPPPSQFHPLKKNICPRFERALCVISSQSSGKKPPEKKVSRGKGTRGARVKGKYSILPLNHQGLQVNALFRLPKFLTLPDPDP